MLIHPVHEQSQIVCVARRDRFHFSQKLVELFRIELLVKLETQKVVGERDLLAHLQFLRKTIGGGEVVGFDCVA